MKSTILKNKQNLILVLFLISLVFIILSKHSTASTTIGVRILGEEGDGCVSDEYCINNLTCVDNICRLNYTLNLTVVNSSYNPIDSQIDIYKGSNLIYSTLNSTNQSQELFYGNKYNLSIHTITSNCSDVYLKNMLNEDDSGEILFGISEVRNNLGDFEQICGINPLIDEFENYDLTINHNLGIARAIYKCKNWNFSSESCIDNNWEKIKIIDNTANQTKIENITLGDPGFGIKSCCGDGVCDLNEDENNCFEDCGTKSTTTTNKGSNSGIIYYPPIQEPLPILIIDLTKKKVIVKEIKNNQEFIIKYPSMKNIYSTLTIEDNSMKLKFQNPLDKTIHIDLEQYIDLVLNQKNNSVEPNIRIALINITNEHNEKRAIVYFENIYQKEEKEFFIPKIDLIEKQYPFDFYLSNKEFFLVMFLTAWILVYPLFEKTKKEEDELYELIEDEL